MALALAAGVGALLSGGVTRAQGQASSSPGQNGPPNARPNILLIVLDDQRWDAMGCYGNRSIRTPNFDRLAREGARFDAFYAASPVCSASRAALLTGLTPHQNGILDNGGAGGETTLEGDVTTLADLLAAAGYHTGFVGKAHFGDPAKLGFLDVPTGGEQPERRSLTEIHADLAIEFMERAPSKPWFLWFAPLSPHTPWTKDPAHPYELGAIEPPPGWPAGQPLSRERWDEYYSVISHLDEQVGRMLAALERLGASANTFVFAMSDNGYMMKSHGLHGKSVWFEESARVCALARGPGVRPESRLATPVMSTDFFATALELAGAPRPPALECVSFLPALAGAPPLRDYAYAECYRPGTKEGGHWQMIVAPPWKYVMHVERPEEYLYDLASDPHEQTSLTGRSEAAAILTEMRAKHAAWLAATPQLR